MGTAGSTGGDAAARFREISFRRLPLVCMAAAAAVSAAAGPGWSEHAGPLPWIVSLGVVGLPHGAADFAASRRAWRGWSLAALWLAYAAAMAVVAAGFAAAPLAAIVAFAVVSCWHFGAAHLDAEAPADGFWLRTVATLARGAAVLAMPFAAWPQATSDAAADLAALAVGRGAAADLFPPVAVQTAGLALALLTVAAGAIEGLIASRSPAGLRAWRRLLIELVVISGLGWFAAPLFSVGLYFLLWHGWRQMEPLAEALTTSSPRSWRELGGAIGRIHFAALPLLIPTWAAIGTVWWQQSADHTLRDVAIVSIAAYLVVTPAHELLGDLLRTAVGQGAIVARRRPPVRLRVQPAAGQARSWSA